MAEANDGPIPLSFPAILRNPGLADRFAHLSLDAPVRPRPAPVKRNRRSENEGKRWVRRNDNAHLVGNPHVVAATKKDYVVPPTYIRATFPKPLPPYLPRNAQVPETPPPVRDPASANAGRFSLSLKGMRRELRKAGSRAEVLVRDIEAEIINWLRRGGTILAPDAPMALQLPGEQIGTTESIREVSRTPLQLVWAVGDDAFARYVVHCCARYHEIVSYSKEVDGQRLTYLLRPNVTRPDFRARAGLDTPPVTDLDYSSQIDSSQIDTDSDLLSERDLLSDVSEGEPDALAPAPAPAPAFEAIDESAPLSPRAAPQLDDTWSVIGDTDVEGDESGGEGLAAGVRRLSLRGDADRTPRAEPRVRQAAPRTRLWEHRTRSSSSPSRSPARRPPRWIRPRVDTPSVVDSGSGSFYDFLFA